MEQVIAESRWNTPMKIMVIGHARHGKDTVGELLKKHYGLSFTSSSLFCANRIMMPAFDRVNAAHKEEDRVVYADAQACYEDRGNHREFWHDEIAAYPSNDLSILVREIFESNDVYCGCRNDREFLQAKGEGLYNLSLWVDASLRHPPEKRGSMKLEKWMADEVVDNNGTEEQLERNLLRIVNPFVVAFRAEWRRLRAEGRVGR
jgi:hypothetical protein